jgi:hypothetical protein
MYIRKDLPYHPRYLPRLSLRASYIIKYAASPRITGYSVSFLTRVGSACRKTPYLGGPGIQSGVPLDRFPTYPCNRPWGLLGFEMLRIQHCLDNRLTVNCEILATCSSTYSPVRTSQEPHSVSIK